MGVLDGKVAIITGGARGIGKGMATAVAKAGAGVTITDVRADLVAETADGLPGQGLDVLDVRKVSEPGDGPSVVDLIRRGRCNLVVNTPDHGSEPRSDGYLIRTAALAARVPCITTVAAATAAVHAIANARVETALSLQERMDAEAAARAS